MCRDCVDVGWNYEKLIFEYLNQFLNVESNYQKCSSDVAFTFLYALHEGRNVTHNSRSQDDVIGDMTSF